MSNELQILDAEQISAIDRATSAQIDMQIATAKKYPRDIQKALKNIVTIATYDEEVASECFYALKRGGADSDPIEGLSVRLTEIMALEWKNLRISSTISGNNGKKITATGICFDLENNVAISIDVDRSIINKRGETYSQDMIVVTGNAAGAIARRNAILGIIPKAVTKKAVEQIAEVAKGQALDLETSRTRAVQGFGKLGVNSAELLAHVGKIAISDLNKEDILYLRGLMTALKEGTATIHSTFREKKEEKVEAAKTAASGNTMAALNKLGKSKVAAEAPAQPKAEENNAEQTPPADEAKTETEFPEVAELSRNGSREAKNAQVITDLLKGGLSTEEFDNILTELELKDFIGFMDFALRASKENVIAVFQYLV